MGREGRWPIPDVVDGGSILGISCHYHDSAACLVQDGRVVAAAQEERFNRQKSCPDFPLQAVNYCLQEGGITIDDLDRVAFYEKPYLKFHRVILEHVRSWPFSWRNFLGTVPNWLLERLSVPWFLERELGYSGEVSFLKHHLSHAASAYLVSPFEEAAILTADGVGEWTTSTAGVGRGNSIEVLREQRYPHSLGLLYSAITSHLGFRINSGEGKVMGLAAYGEPAYRDAFRKMVDVRPDGSFRLDRSYFGFNQGRTMCGRRVVSLLGPAREPESELEQRHHEIAASLQELTEELLIAQARELQRETGLRSLCLAGGVFLNCLTNHRILEETPFERVFVQPASGDSGGALGAAVGAGCLLLGQERGHIMRDAFLGPSYSTERVRRALRLADLPFREMEDDELLPYVARRLEQNAVVGWFQGRMEFGPRALGNRSILGNPGSPEMQDILNNRIKKREPFRPFAPSVLKGRAEEYFELLDHSPYMLLAPRTRPEKLDAIPAVVHVDGTARVQVVEQETNPRYWRLISCFEERTGLPMVVNTSFNQRGEPIVCTPEDAIDCFRRSRIDCLALEGFVVERDQLGSEEGRPTE